MSLLVILALVSVVVLNENTDFGSSISDFMARVGISDAKPTPSAPALAIAPSPTQTAIPPTPSPTGTAPVPTNTATPSPTGTPTPMPTFTMTPRPIPTISPAAYVVEAVRTELLDNGQVDILITVVNEGGEAGEELTTVEVRVGSGIEETINIMGRLSPGESRTLALTLPLKPGSHSLEFKVGDSWTTVNVDVEADSAVVASAPDYTRTPGPAATFTPRPTKTPEPTPAPANTPVPVVRLALHVETTVLGYWSDGTADAEVTATLRNDGGLRLDGVQRVTATCIADGDPGRDCHEEMSLSLPDGYAPSSGSFILRLPIGVTSLVFDYGGDESLTLDVEVPERVLGVDRYLWECYAHRPAGGVEIAGSYRDSCGGWSTPTVEKWLNDVPVKVWATGDPDYIAVLKTVLTDLAPALRLEFEWVATEKEADFTAFVGVPRSEASALGFDRPTWVEWWGFAGATVNGGEVTSGYIVIWDIDLDTSRSPIDSIRSVTIHEALHALVPIGHSTRPVSIMGGSSLNAWSPRDRQLIELNSHPLVRPGMSMDEVREVVVLNDELLDHLQADSDVSPADPLDLVWRTYVELEEAGSASYRLSGGWTDRACNQKFGVRRGPIEIAIGDFRIFDDDPALLHLDLHTARFYAGYSRTGQEWRHWQLSPEGAWERVARESVTDATSWWLWNGKLHRAIRSVLMDGSSEDIIVDTTTGGELLIHVTLDASYVNMWDWTGRDSLDLALVLDPATYALVGYTWTLHKNPDVHSGSCLTYQEVGTGVRLGVEMEVPEEIRKGLADSR